MFTKFWAKDLDGEDKGLIDTKKIDSFRCGKLGHSFTNQKLSKLNSAEKGLSCIRAESERGLCLLPNILFLAEIVTFLKNYCPQ